ncbi:MAG: dTDP-glucose 4,6-dehydratase [Candidatus Magasanikbacteria bacterium GW2011_GWA2_37_8]|uniref:dTDP-glucose 4,6-dehydratase n=1 Tax=Candidatus Magasanikbacteria bacterium GW2011_GWA2_37_8 TaxID=1619036 RepID=A0A0G0JU88_9BACT|nr:MAG: dTDP-glucose 4,6-dehydratase [Candidatus Magasanikbacteria bacterium GW2011_GWA2_37_8]
MKILVCGGAGFIGSNFVHYILENFPHYQVVNFDKLTYAGNLENLKDIEDDLAKSSRYTFVKGDICDYKLLNEVVDKYQIDHIINFAAETHVDRSIFGDCTEFVMTNTFGVLQILNLCRHHKITKFVNVSTDEVYGTLALESNDRFTESTPICPNMPYAAAKAGGDMLAHSYFITHKIPVVVTHCSNNYGSYQYPEKLIPSSVFRLLKNKPILIHGSGRNVRDWIHVRDHCRALYLMLEKGIPGEVYNVGVDNERSNLEIAKMILRLMNLPETMIEFVEDRPGNDLRYAIDSTKLQNLGWSPVYTHDQFEVGMSETINWYLTHRDWVEDLWGKHEEAYKINHTPTVEKKQEAIKKQEEEKEAI